MVLHKRMRLKFLQGLLICFLSVHAGLAQYGSYSVVRTDFSSDKYDEFSPVYYKNGIVFCTNRGHSLIYNYSPSENKGVFKIFFADTSGAHSAKKARLFSRALKTNYNDGPVCFNKSGDTIYFSRNIMADKKLHDQGEARNKLGIFSSVSADKSWTKVRELRINNEWYNVTTPWLSPDSRTLYFASDKPGGYGGSDLYYSQWRDGFWDNPVNMGPVINTVGNEAFPYVNSPGEIIFSSDGHNGPGGKDIFYSKYEDSHWLEPVPFDPPINSVYDDFGLVTDSLMDSGYFSSNRERTVDIYKFRTVYPQVFYSNPQRTNQYCFRLSDTDPVSFDKQRFGYQWNFGEKQTFEGETVNYCFPGPGKYSIKLNLIEKATGSPVFLEQLIELVLRNVEQPVISCPETSSPGMNIEFDGLKSNLPGKKILEYTWNFGDGTRAKGAATSHTYVREGEYTVTLSLKTWQFQPSALKQFSVSKKINITTGKNEKGNINGRNTVNKPVIPDLKPHDFSNIKVRYSAGEEIRKGAVFRVELLSSRNRISPANPDLKKFSQKYRVREVYSKEDSLYSYVTDDEGSISESYPVLVDARALGYKSAIIETSFLSDPAEIELNNLKKAFGLSSDNFFEKNSERINTAGYAFLDQIALLMNKYPGLRLFIEVHCDEDNTDWSNLMLSQKRAESMGKYLISKNINPNRFIAEGYGRTRRIVSADSGNISRKINNRVQFRVIS